MIPVLYFLAFMPAATAYDYDYRGHGHDPRLRYEMNVAYRTLSDCLIAAEAKDRFYRGGSSWLVRASCTIDNPNDHR